MKASLRIIVIVAHPDEAEEYAAGTIALLSRAGHFVKVLSMTNGDVGHLSIAPKALARRRAHEAYEAGRILSIADYEILDHHDSELTVEVAARDEVVRRIRRWQADIVLTFHEECAGHSDNRSTAKLVREAVNLVRLPNVCRDIPVLASVPVCLRMVDFGSIDHHRHDIVVDIDDVVEQKLRACAAHATQFFEFAPADRGLVVPDTEDPGRAREFILEYWSEFFVATPEMRPALASVYGDQHADHVSYAETFELASYGRDIDLASARAFLRDAIAQPAPLS